MDSLDIDSLWIKVKSRLFAESRLKTFSNWPYKPSASVLCTPSKLALAGFVSSATSEEPSSAICVFCDRDLIFDPEDDPWKEHAIREPECPLIRLNNKSEVDWEVEEAFTLIKHLALKEMSSEFDTIAKTIEEGYNDILLMNDKTTM
ncbi:unnamed protein product [Auanema sp. JU1783]|nr:unnamed protein product [Auanema sp. JU1783]